MPDFHEFMDNLNNVHQEIVQNVIKTTYKQNLGKAVDVRSLT